MRTNSRLLAIVFCLLLACACFAQGGGRQRGGRRNNLTLSGLIFRTDVQTDLALTEDEKTKLEGMRESFRPQRPAGGGGTYTRPTPEEMATREESEAKQIDSVLTPEQSKRLREIQIQLEGPQAIARPAIQASLGLSSTQIDQIKSFMKSYREANQSISAKIRDQEIDRTAGREEMQKNLTTLKDNLTKVLTSEQATKLKELGGKPFTADPAPAGR